MRGRLNPNLTSQIRRLLSKQHTPLVEVRSSSVAGRGVFARSPLKIDIAVALYPGIFTPSHPQYLAAIPAESIFSVTDLYLANTVSPSGIKMEDNAYILNLQSVGGYLDGEALKGNKGRPLDWNPSACAHMVNHSPRGNNVAVESFFWSDILERASTSTSEQEDTSWSLPNERRSDGSPWYLLGDQIVHFPDAREAFPDQNAGMICGAAFVTTREIGENEELLLNYALRKPYPNWAKGWYASAL